jgi:hypothetical protein
MKLLLHCHNNERHNDIKSKINSINVYHLSFHKLISIIYIVYMCMCLILSGLFWWVKMPKCEEMVQSVGIWTITLQNFGPSKAKGIEKITLFFISHWYEDAIERPRSIIKMANRRWGTKLATDSYCDDRNWIYVSLCLNWKNWTW